MSQHQSESLDYSQQSIPTPKLRKKVCLQPQKQTQNYGKDPLEQQNNLENIDRRANQTINTINAPNGRYQTINASDLSFQQQYRSFLKNGYAKDPNQKTNALILDPQRFPQLHKKALQYGESINLNHPQIKSLEQKTLQNQKNKKKREKWGIPGIDFKGPWAGFGQNFLNDEIQNSQKQQIQKNRAKRMQKKQQKKTDQQEPFDYSSDFYWAEIYDYKGKSFIQAPNDYRIKKGVCYVPKKQTASWTSTNHSGYQVAKFFPKYGHFILSGNIQGHVKLFDVIKDRTLVRTYYGHSKGVRDVQFTNDGKHFLSSSYDKKVLYWDTQKGKVINYFKIDYYPYCVKFNPEYDKQNFFLVGTAMKKIIQYDINSGKHIMNYDQHLGAINTITFVDHRKFVSSSDDKKIFMWEFGIPVVVKHISQPQMHAVTATSMHPNGIYYAGQSSDNKIVIYQHKDNNLRANKKKFFTGHQCAGYSCGISFSNDGQFIASGDQKGRLYFYDWKTCKNYRTLQAHDGVCVGVQWHSTQTNRVLTCGWQGKIKLWQ